MEKRNRYTSEFKTKVVLEVLREEQTVNEIAAKYELSPVMISRWKAEFLERASTVFEKKAGEADKMRKEYESKQERLEKLVGQLTVEVDWLKKNLASNESTEIRKAMVEQDNPEITVKRQAELLSVNRTSVYRSTREQRECEENVQLMHRIDEIYMKHPYYGYRRMTRVLRDQGFEVNRKRIRRLMRIMGLEAVYPKPNLSKRLHATYTRPYLLRALTYFAALQLSGRTRFGESTSPICAWAKALCTCFSSSIGTAAKSLITSCPARWRKASCSAVSNEHSATASQRS